MRIVLTEEEDRTLLELRVATCVPQRTRNRAHMLRLNAQGWNDPAIAEIFECHEHTVRATIRRWQSDGLGGLWQVSPSQQPVPSSPCNTRALSTGSLLHSRHFSRIRPITLNPNLARWPAVVTDKTADNLGRMRG